MLVKKTDDIRSSEITDKRFYLNRRAFIAGAAVVGTAALGGGTTSEDGFPRISRGGG